MHFTRWDQLTETDDPDVVIFFARPEALAGLFTLANFDQGDPNGVICPMGEGCKLHHPLSVARRAEAEGRAESRPGHVRSIGTSFRAPRRPDHDLPDEEVREGGRVHGGELPCDKGMGEGREEDRAERGASPERGKEQRTGLKSEAPPLYSEGVLQALLFFIWRALLDFRPPSRRRRWRRSW